MSLREAADNNVQDLNNESFGEKKKPVHYKQKSKYLNKITR